MDDTTDLQISLKVILRNFLYEIKKEKKMKFYLLDFFVLNRINIAVFQMPKLRRNSVFKLPGWAWPVKLPMGVRQALDVWLYAIYCINPVTWVFLISSMNEKTFLFAERQFSATTRYNW